MHTTVHPNNNLRKRRQAHRLDSGEAECSGSSLLIEAVSLATRIELQKGEKEDRTQIVVIRGCVAKLKEMNLTLSIEQGLPQPCRAQSMQSVMGQVLTDRLRQHMSYRSAPR